MAIKEEIAHFAARGEFRRDRGGRKRAGARTISRTLDGGYAVQGYSLRPAINCFHCKKDGHGWRDCTLYLATKEGKKWKASDKGKLGAARGTPSNTIQERASLALAVDEDESEEVDICLSCTDDHAVEASQLASDEALLYFLYSQVVSASVTPSPISTQPSNVDMIAGSDLRKSESQSWHLDSVCSRHLTSEKHVFVGHLTESLTKIECANGNYLTTKGIGKIKRSCLKENGSASSTTINDVLNVLEAKANLLFLGQLSERGVDMRTTGAKMYLYRGGKKVMKGSRIGRVGLMNSINWLVRALSAREVVVKDLKKDKNDILYARLGHIGESDSKRISHMVEDIDGNSSKVCLCGAYIGAKIPRNLSKKPISAVTEKLERVHMDL